MKWGLYIALVCGILSGATIFFQVPIFPSIVFPVLIGMIGIIATLWTLPNRTISPMLKVGGVLINFLPVAVGLMQWMNTQ
ncbi:MULTISPECIES: hypothetical protein [Staphylococcus]|uniref:Membrane protein n=1 Tax=Staphylococcus schleiferi TaxID=1295 RepID=A0A7Z7VWT0_STASC|nr:MULTISPECIES: hypothetical protein [Staphylococcus]QGS45965.1 hypothetical protein FOB90_04365 [Mammaliicoccus fleurettii]EPD48172.1 hypothetical protein HMPREF1208_02222 [Staphylococcus sp. HGB0015]MBF1992909.1 hypothetical protein [Staphylococcus schleiferi]MBF2038381.1 hypothetical protein [Staphylococcus schleiferi]MBF2100408.1 hypothetical protein [Staphylococcus schleiferi]